MVPEKMANDESEFNVDGSSEKKEKKIIEYMNKKNHVAIL
jgi:hypothetical protein